MAQTTTTAGGSIGQLSAADHARAVLIQFAAAEGLIGTEAIIERKK